MSSKKTKIGTRLFGDTIEITDPCYREDVWCRMNDVKIKPGEYTCYITIDEHDIVHSIAIELSNEKNKSKWECIGSIGVDAGLAGFFENKPDFNDDEWDVFCRNLSKEEREGINGHFVDSGFFSNSGYGDGQYKVFARKNEEDVPVALKIDFFRWAD